MVQVHRARKKDEMGSFLDTYSKIIGLLVLSYVIIFLFSTPSMLTAKSITTIDTELSRASGSETFVRAKLDFGSIEHMRAFPSEIGDWSGSEYNMTRTEERLGADMMLMRAYSDSKLYQPVFFLIMQSENRSSFHPPIVCYPALGYTVQEEGKESIFVRNIRWIEEPLFHSKSGDEQEESAYFNGTISVKKLVVTKESNGTVTERRVILYYYVKEDPFSSDTVTMIRVSALAPVEGSYDGILNITKEFMGDTTPYMFEVRKEEPKPFYAILASGSPISKLALVLLFIPPLMIIFYPQIQRLIKNKPAQ